MKKISDITRIEILELLKNGYTPDYEPSSEQEIKSWPLKINIYGRLDEISFLKRIYDFSVILSNDDRFDNFEGEIWQHTINNDDYPEYWIFIDERLQLVDGPDEVILDFLKEIFHPAVRKIANISKMYLYAINALLFEDGYEICVTEKVSGKEVYGWKDISKTNTTIINQSKSIVEKFDTEYIRNQINEMNNQIEKNPTAAIGLAKELVETCCISILNDKKVIHNVNNISLTQLVNLAMGELMLLPKYVDNNKKGSTSIKRILGNLVNISQGMAELRNDYGNGHGKDKNFKGLQARHANLAVGAATTLVYFLWNTHTEL